MIASWTALLGSLCQRDAERASRGRATAAAEAALADDELSDKLAAARKLRTNYLHLYRRRSAKLGLLLPDAVGGAHALITSVGANTYSCNTILTEPFGNIESENGNYENHVDTFAPTARTTPLHQPLSHCVDNVRARAAARARAWHSTTSSGASTASWRRSSSQPIRIFQRYISPNTSDARGTRDDAFELVAVWCSRPAASFVVFASPSGLSLVLGHRRRRHHSHRHHGHRRRHRSRRHPAAALAVTAAVVAVTTAVVAISITDVAVIVVAVTTVAGTTALRAK